MAIGQFILLPHIMTIKVFLRVVVVCLNVFYRICGLVRVNCQKVTAFDT